MAATVWRMFCPRYLSLLKVEACDATVLNSVMCDLDDERETGAPTTVGRLWAEPPVVPPVAWTLGFRDDMRL